jgi:antitoxin component of RelBE/YafQ-DinJ toxin-antitoxin module
MSRTEQIRIRVSPDEKARAEQVAAAEGLTISAYLRRVLFLTAKQMEQQKRAA